MFVMKRFISTLIVFVSILFSVQAQNTAVPEELKPFILDGYEVLDFAKNDMNGDSLEDYILILKIKGEDTLTYENEKPDAARPLLLIIRQADKPLKHILTNNELVYCKQCGGVMGDPYQSITTKPGEFTLDFYGGSSWRWSDNYTFRYDKIKKDWFLQSHYSSSFQSGDPDNTTETTVINRSETGDVTLKQFTPYYNADSSSWKVNAVKAYFYASPDLKTKPKKAYLVKGNEVISFKQFKNFVQCSFTNGKGTATSGFLLKKDLQLLQANKPKAIQ
jgi:hypothetical protein